jgi:hypothetical protein
MTTPAAPPPPFQIHRISVGFAAIEDRLRLDAADVAGQARAFWLTRRIVLRWGEAMAHWLTNSNPIANRLPSALVGEALSMEHAAAQARAQAIAEPSARVVAPTPPALVLGLQIKPQPGGCVVDLEAAGAPAARLTLDRPSSHRTLGLLARFVKQAEWWPDKGPPWVEALEVSAPPSGTPRDKLN